MNNVTLGKTGIVVPQNAFGALPIQRIPEKDAIHLLRKAFDGGMRYFDTARAYSNSEERVGKALCDVRDQIILATKTLAKNPQVFWSDLHTSLELLQTDHIDVYQFHMVEQCWRPGDGTSMYECMLEAKEKGLIDHIACTAHKIEVAFECVESGLYELLQFPFSYLSGERELELLEACQKHNVGFVCMKGMAGGLIANSEAAMAFMSNHPSALPIWGIQKESELDEWLSYMRDAPALNDDLAAFIDKEKRELSGDFCRGCGYCAPCPQGIIISQCARMSLMLRRAPSESWLNDYWQAEMKRTSQCTQCYACQPKCPYGLDIPVLLKKNYEDYLSVLAGETVV